MRIMHDSLALTLQAPVDSSPIKLKLALPHNVVAKQHQSGNLTFLPASEWTNQRTSNLIFVASFLLGWILLVFSLFPPGFRTHRKEPLSRVDSWILRS